MFAMGIQTRFCAVLMKTLGSRTEDWFLEKNINNIKIVFIVETLNIQR